MSLDLSLRSSSSSTGDLTPGAGDDEIDEPELQSTDLATTWQARKQPTTVTLRAALLPPQQSVEDRPDDNEAPDLTNSDETGRHGPGTHFSRQRGFPKPASHDSPSSEDSVARDTQQPHDHYVNGARSSDESHSIPEDGAVEPAQGIFFNASTAGQTKPTRFSASCSRCVLKKVKCNRQQPCSTCQKYPGVECVYADPDGIASSSKRDTSRRPFGAANDLDVILQSTPVPDSATDDSPEPPALDHLQALRDMGFEFDSARMALRATRGDFDQALDLLLGTSSPEDLIELSPSRQLAVQRSLEAPVFPGMSQPYTLPESAITCLIDGCPRRGQEPEKTAGSMRARLREHMKRRHGWPREKLREVPGQLDLPSSRKVVQEKPRLTVQASISSPTAQTSPRKLKARKLSTSDADHEKSILHARSCFNCDATSSTRWHPEQPTLAKTTLCHRCYMVSHRNGTSKSHVVQVAGPSPVSPKSAAVASADVQRKCSHCSATSTSQWHPQRARPGQRILCRRCYMYEYRHGMPRPLVLMSPEEQPSAKRAADASSKSALFVIEKDHKSCANCFTKSTPRWGNDSEGRILCQTCIDHSETQGNLRSSYPWKDEGQSQLLLASAKYQPTSPSDSSDGPIVFKRRKIYQSPRAVPDPGTGNSITRQGRVSQNRLNGDLLDSIGQSSQSAAVRLQPLQRETVLSTPLNEATSGGAILEELHLENARPQSSTVPPPTTTLRIRLDRDGPAELAQKFGNETTVQLVASLYSLPMFETGAFSKGTQFALEEDCLITHLKEELNLKWDKIQTFLPHRSSWMTLQAHYSQKLNQNPRRSRVANETREIDTDQGEEFRMHNNPMDVGRRRSRRAVANVAPGAYVEPPPLNSQSFELQQQASIRNGISDEENPAKHNAHNAYENVRGTNISRRPIGATSRDSRAFDVEEILRERDLAALASGIAKMTRSNRRSTRVLRPYLSRRERHFLQQDRPIWDSSASEAWKGAVLHVDFEGEELQRILLSANEVFGFEIDRPDLTIRQRIALQIYGASRAQLAQVADKLIRDSAFINRSHESVEQFLLDIAVSKTERQRRVTEASYLATQTARNFDLYHHLRELELGNASHTSMRNALDTLGPHLYFKGTSSDVNVVNWASDGNRFVVGSAALTDESSMQYNRSNNLLFGDVSDGTLQELAQHATKRSAAKGVNARHEMMATQEPFLFHTISAAQFTPDGRTMITTGYDCTAVLWDVSDKTPRAGIIYPHSSAIDVLAVNSSGLFATGMKSVFTKKQYPAVRILRYDIDQNSSDWETTRGQAKLRKYYSQRGPDIVEPSCLRFGQPFGGQDKYLLAGFCSRVGDYGSGEVTLWDVTRENAPLVSFTSTNVFDAVWSPTNFGVYAVGYSASHSKSVNRGTRSVVRLFDSLRTPDADIVFRKTRKCELECPALDINDLVFCDKDANLISAGCTNGNVYTWDLRMPDDILHTFEHGSTLSVHFHEDDLERVDTGVRFLSWGHGSRHLYSGSSDGVVIAWDPYRSTEDAFLRDVVKLDSGVMSGAFSPDFTDLLIGDIHGSVSLLSVGSDRSPELDLGTATGFNFQEAIETKEKLRRKYGGVSTSTPANKQPEAAAAADELIRSGQVELRPFGNLPVRQAVQGPHYTIPSHDGHSDVLNLRAVADTFQEKLRLHETEPRCVCTSDPVPFTEEEQGDSGAWKQRIPAAMRFNDTAATANDGVPRLASMPNLLSRDGLDVRCFRCNKSNLKRGPATPHLGDVFMCDDCCAQWHVDVLGYTPLRPRHADKERAASEPSDFVHIDVSEADGAFAPEAEVDDFSMEVSKHYHSMWGQTQTRT